MSEDHINELSDFGKAFAAAHKSGLKNFSFGGKSYNTRLATDKPASSGPKNNPGLRGPDSGTGGPALRVRSLSTPLPPTHRPEQGPEAPKAGSANETLPVGSGSTPKPGVGEPGGQTSSINATQTKPPASGGSSNPPTSSADVTPKGTASFMSQDAQPKPEYESGGKKKKMSEEINPLIASFLALQSKNPANMFEAAKKLSKKQDEKLDVVDDDKIDAKDLAALRAGKKKVEEAAGDETAKRETSIGNVTKDKPKEDPSLPKTYPGAASTVNGPNPTSDLFKNKITKEEVHTNPNPQTKKPYTAPETSVKQPKWKINKKDQYKMNEEEVEQIDEIGDTKAGQKALKSYVKKADRSSEKSGDVLFNPSNRTYRAAEKGKPGAEEKYSAASLSYHNRLKGMEAAKKRIKEENEEVEFSQAEIDHINSFFLEASVAPVRPEDTEAKSTSEKLSQNDLTATAESGKKGYFDDRKVKKVREEVELDEISKSKAGKTIMARAGKGVDAEEKGDYAASEKHFDKFAKSKDRFAKKFGQKSGDKMTDAVGMRFNAEEVELEEGRPKKNPTPETTERDPRKHIQVEAGRAAAGNVVDFHHNDGTKSKITPGMGRRITSHLNGLKPADRQAAVNKMHDSAEGLKV